MCKLEAISLKNKCRKEKKYFHQETRINNKNRKQCRKLIFKMGNTFGNIYFLTRVDTFFNVCQNRDSCMCVPTLIYKFLSEIYQGLIGQATGLDQKKKQLGNCDFFPPRVARLFDELKFETKHTLKSRCAFVQNKAFPFQHIWQYETNIH